MRRLLLFSLGFAAAWPSPQADARQARHAAAAMQPGQTTQEDAEEADRNRAAAEARQSKAEQAAAAAAAEADRLAALRVEAAARLRQTEDEVAAQAANVSQLAELRDAAAAQLAARGRALGPVLPLIERLALFPAETLLAAPAGPGQAMLGLSVLHGMARNLEREAQSLREEQEAVAAASRAVEAALPPLKAARAEQAEQARSLDRQIIDAQAVREQAEAAGAEAARQVASEGARAETIRAALAAVEAARARAEAQAEKDAARAERRQQAAATARARQQEAALAKPSGAGFASRSALVQPVAGQVLRGWGDDTGAGASNGVSYRPAPQARVVAPCAGRIRFAAPFRSYGQLIILDCGGGYAFVLAGLGRLDIAAGAKVLAGEPVGVMPDWDAAKEGPRPALYIELRHDGSPVDPAPFLHARG